ncbi:RusA family crossover junction endodeoxyribonuclease [Sphingomonas sp. MA1305]|uniref:RusA family crossover junction endodeoxyribonuclease n=1 Tax=Sphingomonas sp. MA1305 TaxID=2479204 RepID=UPI0018DF92C7|nr:RusA family crossover junction endodeoxyribonuclease [Sphingomonas sp. MA1305]
MTFDLPMPPTSNNLFVTDKRTMKRFPSPAYKAWKKAAGDALQQQYAALGGPAVHRPVALTIRLNLNYQSDIANREKAITDLLVDKIEMPDDRYIDRVLIERDRTVEGAVVTIEGSYIGEARSLGELIKPIMARIADQVSE